MTSLKRSTGFRRQAEAYLGLLRLLGEETFAEVAKDLSVDEGHKVTESAVRGRLIRGRRLSENAEWFIQKLTELRNSNNRARKFSLSSELREKPKRRAERTVGGS